ncbi:MAG: signal peptidase II [Lachnospiraceae bacterium]|nr:signal peptidase II [Lachnospiraceae bacterium]
MFGFLTFGTTLTVADLAVKNEIEKQDAATFPREMEGSKGWIWLYKNHNPGFSFGFLKGSRAVELVPLCITSGIAGAWAYMMGVRGRIAEKFALTLVLAGGLSNLLDRMKRGYVVDYFSIQWKALKKVVFNLADIFIILGSLILVGAQMADAVKDMLKVKKN